MDDLGKQLTPAERKQQTTEAVDNKVNAMFVAIKHREKDRYYGLPKSIETFAKWSGESSGNPLKALSRQTIESRPDLKVKVREVLDMRKPDVQHAKSSEDKVKIKRLEEQIKGLASENHLLHLELSSLQRDLSLRESKIKILKGGEVNGQIFPKVTIIGERK
tara:strand:- start:61010 stop:61495 length:486 start_codon:yes stop_codon:yes gene_type:complete